MSKNIFSLLAVFSGALLAICLTYVVYPLENYYVSGFLSELIVIAFRAFFGFLAGVYAISILRWLPSKREKDIVPAFILMGTVVAGVAGLVISSASSLLFDFLGRTIFRGSHVWGLVYSAFQGGHQLLVAVLVYFGIRFAFGFQKEVPKDLKRRSALASLGFVVLALPILLSIRGLDFPYFSSIGVRHEWALKKFANHYSYAVDFVRKSAVIRADVGDKPEVAPAAFKDNRICGGMDGSTAVFTLEVQGARGRGICWVETDELFDQDNKPRLQVMAEYGRNPLWEIRGKAIHLDADGNIENTTQLTTQFQPSGVVTR